MRTAEQGGGAVGVFVTGMGAGGLALARQAGLEPLGLVYGVVNRVSASGGVNMIGEQKRSAQAHLEALHTTLQQMCEQARALGADGVAAVAIELRAEAAPGSEFTRLIECRAGGTAVRDAAAPDGAPLWCATLSAQELWALLRAGYVPKTIAAGYGSIYANGDRWVARRQLRGESTRATGQNIELTWMAEALQQVRRLAMAGVETEAKQAGAAGVVGLRFEQRVQHSGTTSVLVELQAIGTAIAPLRTATGSRPQRSP